jgi:pterin-4a-carbinolamine dehydratase
MAFVNALAFIANREDHHPDLGVHYDRCVVRFSTHDVGGLERERLHPGGEDRTPRGLTHQAS